MSVLDNVALGAYLRGRAGVVRCGAAPRSCRGVAHPRRSRPRRSHRVGLARACSFDDGREPAARQAAHRRDRARARRRSGAAAARRARRGPALPGEGGACATCCARLRDEGMTILLVEHDMDFVMGLTDRLVVMDFGEKLAEGTPADDPARSASCSKPISAASHDAPLARASAPLAGRCSSRGLGRVRQGARRSATCRCTSTPAADRHRHRPERRRQDDAARPR